MNKHTPLSKKDGFIQTYKRKDNISGVTGICYNKNHNRWDAYLWYKHKYYGLGSHRTRYDASRARLLKEIELFGKDLAPQRRLWSLFNIRVDD